MTRPTPHIDHVMRTHRLVAAVVAWGTLGSYLLVFGWAAIAATPFAADLFFVLPLVAAVAWAAVEVAKDGDRSRAIYRWPGPFVVAALGWWLACGATMGSLVASWQRLDAGDLTGSLAWATAGLAVLGAGTAAIAVGRRRRWEPHDTLRLAGIVLFLAGLPLLVALFGEAMSG